MKTYKFQNGFNLVSVIKKASLSEVKILFFLSLLYEQSFT